MIATFTGGAALGLMSTTPPPLCPSTKPSTPLIGTLLTPIVSCDALLLPHLTTIPWLLIACHASVATDDTTLCDLGRSWRDMIKLSQMPASRWTTNLIPYGISSRSLRLLMTLAKLELWDHWRYLPATVAPPQDHCSGGCST